MKSFLAWIDRNCQFNIWGVAYVAAMFAFAPEETETSIIWSGSAAALLLVVWPLLGVYIVRRMWEGSDGPILR